MKGMKKSMKKDQKPMGGKRRDPAKAMTEAFSKAQKQVE